MSELNLPISLIEWVDASRLSGNGWMDWDDIPEPSLHRCVSVGYVVKSNDEGVVIVPTIADLANPDNRHTFGGMLIPRSAIVSQRVLEEAF